MIDNKYTAFWVIIPLALLLLIPFVGSSTNRRALNKHGYDTSTQPRDPAVQEQIDQETFECVQSNAIYFRTGTLPEGCDRAE